jgi:hypothetical protein
MPVAYYWSKNIKRSHLKQFSEAKIVVCFCNNFGYLKCLVAPVSVKYKSALGYLRRWTKSCKKLAIQYDISDCEHKLKNDFKVS